MSKAGGKGAGDDIAGSFGNGAVDGALTDVARKRRSMDYILSIVPAMAVTDGRWIAAR